MKGANVVVEAKQSIGRLVTADVSVVKVDVALGIPCEEKVLHILGVEALVGDGVANEEEAIAILEVESGGLGGRGRGCGRLSAGGGNGEVQGEETEAERETLQEGGEWTLLIV
jgi:hypothetical protein